MTVSLDARTPSADLYTLSGSSAPGSAATVQPFGIAAGPAGDVLEMPDTFMSLADAATSVVAGLATARRHPDAEVIDLAGRTKRLAERQAPVLRRIDVMRKRVTLAHPAPKLPVSNEVFHAYRAEIRPTEERIGLLYMLKVRRRMTSRVERWVKTLTGLEPQTQAGLGAKVEAMLAVRDFDTFLLDETDFVGAVGRDALRIIGDEADARYDKDQRRDGALLALGRAWQDCADRHLRAVLAKDDAEEELTLPTQPDGLENFDDRPRGRQRSHTRAA